MRLSLYSSSHCAVGQSDRVGRIVQAGDDHPESNWSDGVEADLLYHENVAGSVSSST
jgi:hypothetical protein